MAERGLVRKGVGRKAEWQVKGLDDEGLRSRLATRDCAHVEKLDLSFNRTPPPLCAGLGEVMLVGGVGGAA
jgi:hypothetical protein